MPPKSSSKAAEVMKAGERAQRLGRKVDDAKRALTKAEKARDRADARYLALVRESIAGLQQQPAQTGEGVGTQA